MSVRKEFAKAIERKGPSHVPVVVVGHPEISDGFITSVGQREGFTPTQEGETEWGFAWKKLDVTMGQPEKPVLSCWDELEGFSSPDSDAPGRFKQLDAMKAEHPDKYAMCSLGITGFNLMTFIIGFQEMLEGLYIERDKVEKLADIVFAYEEGLVRKAAQHGADAVAFYDDWGTQNGIIINPELWREVFFPRYKRQFDLAHSLGMHVDFHSCGDVYEIIPGLAEAGADMLNLNQPELFGIDRLAKYAGTVCFLCPVDHQRTFLNGTPDEVRAQARELIDKLGRPNGGFVGWVEPFYTNMGVPEENVEAVIEAFREFGKY
jgi:uroporphyrinogen-III decarboxylase